MRRDCASMPEAATLIATCMGSAIDYPRELAMSMRWKALMTPVLRA